MTRLCNHLRQVRFLVKRLQSQIKYFGASYIQGLSQVRQNRPMLHFHVRDWPYFMKLNYLGTMNFKNKISNEPCQYRSTTCCVRFVVDQQRYRPSNSDQNIDVDLSIHDAFLE